MKKNILTSIIIAAIVIAVASFYGGMVYSQSKSSAASQQFRGTGQGGRFQSGPAGQNGTRRGSNGFGGMVGGEIIAKDDKSITIKTQDGSTKIVFISDKTASSKQVSATNNDLTVGETVTVNGEANTDGSINGQFIQIRDRNAVSNPVPKQ